MSRFQPIFSREHTPQLTEQEFRPLLLLENNHHWNGLHQNLPKIIADMPLLREVLADLINDDKAIEERFDYAVDTVPGMARL